MMNRKSLVVIGGTLCILILMSLLLVASVMADLGNPPKTPDAEPEPPLPQTDNDLNKAQDKESAEGTMGLVETLHGERFEPTILQLQPGCDTSFLAQHLLEWQAEGLASPDVIWANNQMQTGIDSELLPRIWGLHCVEEIVGGRLTATPANDSAARKQPDPHLDFDLPAEEESYPLPMSADLEVRELREPKQENPYTPVLEELPATVEVTGSITGTVTADVGGAPLSNIDVNAYIFNGSDWDFVKDEDTDANGEYDIGGLSAGIYRLRFRDPSDSYASEYYDDAADFDSATDINVVIGGVASGKNAALAASAHITGTVTADDGGILLNNIDVNAYRFNGRLWMYAGDDYTDANGNYDIGGLSAGTYWIVFSMYDDVYLEESYDDAPGLKFATYVNIAAGATIADINAALAVGGKITGTVTADVGGAPLSNIFVRVLLFDGRRWSFYKYGYTDANGDYDIGGLETGTYRLRFGDNSGGYSREFYNDAAALNVATDINVVVGGVASGKNAALAAAAHITGTVTAEVGGALLENVLVFAYRFNGSDWDRSETAFTDANGNYDVGGLPAGTYHIEFVMFDGPYSREFYDDASDLNSATDISVAAGATVPDIDAALAPAAHIIGTVTAEVGGALLQNIQILAYRFNGSDWDYIGADTTDANGNYEVGGLPGGIYHVGFLDWHNFIYGTEYYKNAANMGSATDINVTEGAIVPNIDAALSIPLPPGNDDFNAALVVDPVPYQSVVEAHAATTADDDPVLPCGPGDQGHGSVWYKVTPGHDSLITADTFDSSYDTVLAIWEGSRGNLSPVACDDDDGPYETSHLVDVPLASGVTYYIEIAGYGPDLNNLGMGVTLVPVTGSTGSITINKETNPTGGTGFGFSGDLGSFTLDHGQSEAFYQLAVGDYVVTESNSSGWYLDSAACDSESVSKDGNSLTIHLEAGEDISCTFVNRRVSEWYVYLPVVVRP